MSRPLSLCLLALPLLAACAVAPTSPPPNQANQPGYGQPGYAQPPQQQGYPQPTAPPPPPATAAPTSSAGIFGVPAPGNDGDPRTLNEALLRLDSETKRLQAGLATCELACKSLGSMERAVKIVCELARDAERPRCDDARKRLREARARVRSACGECAGGPRTDPDAPDP